MNEMKETKNTCAKTRKQLADEYGISVRTLNRRLYRYGIKPPPGLILPAWQKKIYKLLGNPAFVR